MKCLPADVRDHLVHDRTSDPLTLALQADEIFQRRVASAMNHVSSASILGDDYSVHAGTMTSTLFPFALWPFTQVPFALSRHFLYTSYALYDI